MLSHFLLLAASATLFASGVAAQDDDNHATDDQETCYSYGIDFQDDGSYFINSQSNENFTCTTQFDGCNDDSSYILLINDENGDQFECTNVPTLPSNTSQKSTCPLEKDQMTTGNWTILAMGNNGEDGEPFAWERNFYLSVGPQATTTTTVTNIYNQTTTPITTVTSTSTEVTTTTVPNSQIITVPGIIHTKTITPRPVRETTTKYRTRTFYRWTKTQSIATQTVTPTCTVPPRPQQPDPVCHHVPTIVPIPKGLKIQPKKRSFDKPANVEYVRKRFEAHWAAQARAAEEHAEVARGLAARAPDAPTLTVTAPEAVNSTSTYTAATSTVTDVPITTSTATETAAPSTVTTGVQVIRTTLPASTKTITRRGYTTTWKTKTMSLTWTLTTTITPSASATACKNKGGHFGDARLRL